MQLYQININPISGFYSPLKGDMLFGQFCWAIAENLGQDKLDKLLTGYTQNNPFIVFSDAFPEGYIPKPTLPFTYYKIMEDNSNEAIRNRKLFKRKKWLPVSKASLPTPQMAEFFEDVPYISKKLKTSVHLDPKSGHTSGGQYSAFTLEEYNYTTKLTLYILIDETRITVSQTEELLHQIGQQGYGKKSSSGHGKFELIGSMQKVDFSYQSSTISYLTLAPCVPQPNTFDANSSYYHVFVRFGKHGNRYSTSSNPFKKPVLTADTGAVFTLKIPTMLKFIGTGLTNISQIDNKTVFQGYTPVIPLHAQETKYE